MTNSRERFEKWTVQLAKHHNYEFPIETLLKKTKEGDYYVTWVDSAWMGWQAATAGPDAATVALHFGYEVTKIRDQVFIAKNNACGKVWIPFSRDSHPQVFMEYEKCN